MDNELKHHGVKGMKWGVRRYQKTARSLGGSKFAKNAIAKSRYGSVESKRKALAENAYLSAEKKAKKTGGKMTYDVTTGKYYVRGSGNKKQKRPDYATKTLQKGLNKADAKYKKANDKYKTYEQAYKDTDDSAKKALSPARYAQWVTSGARKSQTMKLNKLKKVSEKKKKKAQDYVNSVSEDYVIAYDVRTKKYTLRSKN